MMKLGITGPLFAAAVTLGVPKVAAAQGTEYDCVIEPSMVVDVGSSANGILREIRAGRGDMVTRGTLIASLHSEVQKASLKLATARASNDIPIKMAKNRLELLDKEKARATELHKKRIVATRTLEISATEREQASLEQRQAQQEKHLAMLDKDYATAIVAQRSIYSPIDGIIVKRLLSPGEYVYDQAVVVQIAKIDPLYVEVYLPIQVYPSIKLGMTAYVRPVEPVGGTFEAKVSVLDKVFDAASDTFGVRLTLPNPNMEMPAGINCTVSFEGVKK